MMGRTKTTERWMAAGISQRDVTQRFAELPAAVGAVEEALLDFHEDHIMAACPLPDCALPTCSASWGMWGGDRRYKAWSLVN